MLGQQAKRRSMQVDQALQVDVRWNSLVSWRAQVLVEVLLVCIRCTNARGVCWFTDWGTFGMNRDIDEHAE